MHYYQISWRKYVIYLINQPIFEKMGLYLLFVLSFHELFLSLPHNCILQWK